MFVSPSEGAVEGAAPVNNNGGVAKHTKEGPTNLSLETSTNVKKKKEEPYYLERTNCRVRTDRGRCSGLGSGDGAVRDLTAGTATRPAAPDGPADSGRTCPRRREGECDAFPGPPADRLAAARGPSAAWFRFLFPRRGAGSTGRPTRNCRDSPARARAATACGARARWRPPAGAR